MEKVGGFDTDSQVELCRHYGFNYSQGECRDDKAGVPVERLVEVAAYHYPVLGGILSKRRAEAAKLRKLCGKNGSKLKSKIAAYDSAYKNLRKASRARHELYKTALNNAISALSAVDHSLRMVESMDGQLAKELSSITRGGARTDVSLVKGKKGYRLSANISTTTSPDAIIREQQYVWDSSEEEDEYDGGFDL